MTPLAQKVAQRVEPAINLGKILLHCRACRCSHCPRKHCVPCYGGNGTVVHATSGLERCVLRFRQTKADYSAFGLVLHQRPMFGFQFLEGNNLITVKLHRDRALQQFQSDNHAPGVSKLS